MSTLIRDIPVCSLNTIIYLFFIINVLLWTIFWPLGVSPKLGSRAETPSGQNRPQKKH